MVASSVETTIFYHLAVAGKTISPLTSLVKTGLFTNEKIGVGKKRHFYQCEIFDG